MGQRERERSGSGPLNRQRAEGRRKKDLPWSGKLRDFWISASLVTREAKTVGQVGLGRRKGEGGGERDRGGGNRISLLCEPFQSVARLNEEGPARAKTYR